MTLPSYSHCAELAQQASGTSTLGVKTQEQEGNGKSRRIPKRALPGEEGLLIAGMYVQYRGMLCSSPRQSHACSREKYNHIPWPLGFTRAQLVTRETEMSRKRRRTETNGVNEVHKIELIAYNVSPKYLHVEALSPSASDCDCKGRVFRDH